MTNPERGDPHPLTTLRQLIPLIVESIARAKETKSLALMNSRSELSFELRLALLALGNDQTLSQDQNHAHARMSTNYYRLLEAALRDIVGKDQDHSATAPAPAPAPALARASRYEAVSPELPLIRLTQRAEELRAIAKKLSGLRKAKSYIELDPGLGRERTRTHHQTMMARERSHDSDDTDNADADESDGADRRHNSGESDTWSPRSVQDPDCSADSGEPHFKRQQTTQRPGPQRQRSSKEVAAENFMDHAAKFYNDEIMPLEEKKAIKVAVLDTGVDQSKSYFKGVRAPKGTPFVEVVSFVKEDPHDSHGHGTDVAALILEMAPHVDLYIGKVCVGKEIDGVDQYVKALSWAIDKKVHIINISASITDDECIKEKIIEAESAGIIIFAAASCDGAKDWNRVFPARLDHVLAIHAADGRGNPCEENAKPKRSADNLITLGSHIASPFGRGAVLSGTSYSTAIASGMAANILTLVGAYLDSSESEEAKSLCKNAFRTNGMKRIFLHASSNENKYDYICPSKLVRASDGRDNFVKWLKAALET